MTRDHRKTSEVAPLRRTRLHRTLGVSALAALSCVGTANATIETDFGVDYRATGFYVESESFAVPQATAEDGQVLDDQIDPDDSDNGFAHYLRLNANFKHAETGVEVHTRVELAGDRWSGDARGYDTTASRAFNADNNGDNVRLDLGFVQVPFELGLLRVGRQEANWNNCFLVCDDRRDRALFLTKLGDISAFIGYDRRQDNTGFLNEDNGNQIFPGLVAPLGDSGWSLGFLYVHWLNNYNGDLVDDEPAVTGVDVDGNPVLAPGSTGARNVYVLSNANIYSPYMQGKVGPMDVAFGGNWLHNGNVNANQTPEDGDYFTEDAYSAYFRLGADVGMFEIKGQYVGSWDGGLISPGFDTYSSLINSSPESTTNPTSVYQMGRYLGREGFDESLYIGSVGVNVTEKFALRGAVGFLDIEAPNATGGTDSDTSTVYDLQASYQLNEAVRTWATLGMLKENDVGMLRGNSLVGATPNGGSFADDRVIAGSVNLGVEF
ncbi:hypothetical protein [Salinisphaera orenii]|uniref:Porin n=1 Tax=Salinisphaera orenii YIM 95161 TaxID=1051139 RepID=A0A423PI64_9GAMM|nr:hypothetical protein [Salinisphaera halophila]ROO25176.1 hypothetical protein SAHL_14835 [Salinisphaera halophila YIM 95161]